MTAAELQEDEAETDTLDIEADTGDVSDDELRKSTEPTEPDSNPKRSARRIRMPSKVEIIQAIESVGTESIEVDEVTRQAAQRVEVEEID